MYVYFKTRTLFYFKVSVLISFVVEFCHTNIYGKTTFDKRFKSFCFFSQVGDYNSFTGNFYRNFYYYDCLLVGFYFSIIVSLMDAIDV